MAYQFKLPDYTFMGENALQASESILRGLGKKAFVVTGKIVTKTCAVQKLTDCLTKWDISYTVFNDICGEPDTAAIQAGVEAFKRAGCDFLIGIGGGSPLDSAKAISAMSILKGSISDYMGVEIKGCFPSVVAIPTTSGTGSEATKFTVITDSAKNVKMLLKGDALLPVVAVVDPAFTESAPGGVTAATGMDALTHAIEAYTSRKGNTLTDLYALDAIKRIFSWLPEAYCDGSNKKAREEMAIAAYEAGVCINNASVTLVHGMSRPIGALFHVPHGISNAMLITECLAFALDGCPDRFAKIARQIGAVDESKSDREAAGTFIGALKELCWKLEIPTLQEHGIERDAFESNIKKMAQDAMSSGSPGNTLREIAAEDIAAIYKRLYQ